MSNLKEQFVSYKIALELKELEFDKDCLARYCIITDFEKPTGEILFQMLNCSINDKYLIKCPLWQQVIDWFREKYDIHIWIYYCMILESHFYQLRHEVSTNEYNNYSNDSESNVMHEFTYKEAREQAVLKAIELIKNEL